MKPLWLLPARPSHVEGKSFTWRGHNVFSPQSISLLLLVVQNSVLTMTLHYSRAAPAGPGPRYLASTAVLLVEVIKLVLSLSVAAHDMVRDHPSKSPVEVTILLYHSCFTSDSWKLIIPAALYTLQNSLVYVAISNLEAVTFQVTYQVKILTTVLFSILLLGRSVSSRQWLSLLLLTVGVAIVQTSSSISSPGTAPLGAWEEAKARLVNFVYPPDGLRRSLENAVASPTSGMGILAAPAKDGSKGLLAVLAAAMISGLTCVYFEKLLKDSLDTVSLWTRNVQLSFYSLFPALFIGVLWQDGAAVADHGFFVGYGPVVWVTILLQAVGGIIVAACMAYADNVAKNYAASASIIVCGVFGAVVFHVPVTANSAIGTTTVLLAMFLYQTKSRAPPLPKDVLPFSKEHSMA